MVYTLEEIKNYLLTKDTLDNAIKEMTESNVDACNQRPTENRLGKTDENLPKYEKEIGLWQLKEKQLQLRRNGKPHKYWLSLSPRWIDEEVKERLNTKYDINYWVNYGDDNTYGAFTVEQIIQWLTTPELQLHTLGGTKER